MLKDLISIVNLYRQQGLNLWFVNIEVI